MNFICPRCYPKTHHNMPVVGHTKKGESIYKCCDCGTYYIDIAIEINPITFTYGIRYYGGMPGDVFYYEDAEIPTPGKEV